MKTQVNRDVGPRENDLKSNMTSRLRDFVSMNPLFFLGSKVGEDPQEFLDGVDKVLSAMGVTSREKAKLASYQLRDVSKMWYTQWKYNRPFESIPIEWDEFKEDLLGKYFPRELREVKVEDFIVKLRKSKA